MHELYSQYPASVSGHTARPEHEMVFHMFGVPVVVATDSETIAKAADAALGRWKSLPTSYREDMPPRRLEILVDPALAARAGSKAAYLSWRRRGDMLAVSGPGIAGSATASAGMVFVAPKWESRGREFADMVAAPLAISLAAAALPKERIFLRASAFVHGDAALVLLAESDAARLDLAAGLHRAGFEMLAADFLLAARHPSRGLELWGHPAVLPPGPAFANREDGTEEPSSGWTPLPLEGGAKVHLQHAGPVLLAVLDGTAPGPDDESFPVALASDAKAVQKMLAALASRLYPLPAEGDESGLQPTAKKILNELSKSRAVCMPASDPEAMLPRLIHRLEALCR